MHHFIYPTKDTFITNTPSFDLVNFGLDEILRVGVQKIAIEKIVTTVDYPFISGSTVTNFCIQGFSGSLASASFYGSASYITGNIFNSNTDPISFTVDFFSGKFTGSVVGYETGSAISASNITKSFLGFSGTMVSIGNSTVNGTVSGSISSSLFEIFNGSISQLTGKILSGSVAGDSIQYNPHVESVDATYDYRSLIQFDISSISKSMSSGDINNPQFKLKLNVARECELPIQYNIYAFPLSQSWVMGDGYLSDGGSVIGANWKYLDAQSATTWSVTGSSYIQSISCTQSFNYQVGDINMDITPIVNAWISGTIVNNGIVLMSSDEFLPTGSGMGLYFFSKDTNTIYEPRLDCSWGTDFTWSTGSLITSSANISSIDAGLLGIVTDSASISGSLYGGFTGFANIFASSSISYSYDTSSGITSSFFNTAANGLMSAVGINGLIISMSIVGNFSGSISHSIDTITHTCYSCIPQFDGGFNYPGGQNQSQYEGHDIYGWGHAFNTFNQYDWTSDHLYQTEFGPGFSGSNCGPYDVTSSFLMGTIIDGLFSGSTFTSSLVNGYILGYGTLVGSWNEAMIDGTSISASYPFKPLYPNAMFVNYYGNYVNGQAFGAITNLSASYGVADYGIFSGVFTSGPLIGIQVRTPFSGSILSASYFYTSSLNILSSSLTPINFQKPFTAIVQNVPSTIKSGDIIRINVFGRQENPIKNFNRQTQFTQFLTPQYLPSSSYYAIKDNETEEIILDFDNYTQISCDPNGNYFLLDTTSYPQERYFKLLIRVQASGSIYTFDKSNIFKIVR